MIFHLKQCDSTNLELKRRIQARTAAAGDAVVADVQTGGRGRIGRSWASNHLGLYLSWAFCPARQAVTWTPLWAGVIACEVLRRLGALQVSLKWPNDLLNARRHKVGGLLCEAAGDLIVVGIGINREPPAGVHGPHGPAAGLGDDLGERWDRLLPELLHALNREAGLGRVPSKDIESRFWALSAWPIGATIAWRDRSEQLRSGRVMGLGHWGELKVMSTQGELGLFAEEVSVSREDLRGACGSPP